MTHTFLKRPDHYEIGQWVRNEGMGATFVAILRVTTLTEALRVINLLNGGEGKIGDFITTKNLKVVE